MVVEEGWDEEEEEEDAWVAGSVAPSAADGRVSLLLGSSSTGAEEEEGGAVLPLCQRDVNEEMAGRYPVSCEELLETSAGLRADSSENRESVWRCEEVESTSVSEEPSLCSTEEELVNEDEERREENRPAVLLEDPTRLSVLLHVGRAPELDEIRALDALTV